MPMVIGAESHEENIAQVARAEPIRRLLGLWEDLAGDGLPLLPDLMEAGLAAMMDNAALLVPDGESRFTYVYYGRALLAGTGVERTGLTTDDLPARIREFVRHEYRKVMDSGRPIYIVNVADARPEVDTWERLVVPVRTHGNLRLLVMLAEPHDLRETVSSAVLDASPDPIIAFRVVEDDLGTMFDARIVSVNESACRMIRRSREQLLQASMLQTFPQVQGNGIWEQCREVLTTRRAVRFDINGCLVSSDGQFRISLFPLHGGFAMTLQDITDLSGDAIPMIRRRVCNVQPLAAVGY